MNKRIKKWLYKVLPMYIPKRNDYYGGWYIAIWNCGLRPQTLKQILKDIRITVRKNGNCKFVIKKGSI